MKTILMDTYYIIGENAEAAADYINEQESRMTSCGAANPYFDEDYSANLSRFKRDASEKFGVMYKNIWEA